MSRRGTCEPPWYVLKKIYIKEVFYELLYNARRMMSKLCILGLRLRALRYYYDNIRGRTEG